MNSRLLDEIGLSLFHLLGDGIVITHFCLEHYSEKFDVYDLPKPHHLVLTMFSTDAKGNRYVETLSGIEHGNLEQPLNVVLPIEVIFK
jgi:hypothetical protein